MNEKLLAANYGRAAFHALVECSTGINPFSNNDMLIKMTSQICSRVNRPLLASALFFGSRNTTFIAKTTGCGAPIWGININSLTNGMITSFIIYRYLRDV